MTIDDAAIGMQLARMGRFAEALPHLEAANRRAPADVSILHAVASLLLQSAGRANDAAERYRIAAGLLPSDISILVGWARTLLLLGDSARATDILARALMVDPRIAEPGGMLGMVWNADDPDAACAVLAGLVERHPDNADLLFQYAQALVVSEYLDEAQSAYDRYRQLRPDDPMGHVDSGRLAAGRGDTAFAIDCFHAALAIDADHPHALAEWAQTRHVPLDPQTHARISALADATQNPEHAGTFNDILARHDDRVGNFAGASVHIAMRNALHERLIAPQQRYDPQQHALEIDVAIANQTPAFFDRLGDAGNRDVRPVFVVGLPRSGTTLLERMLASHPDIVGVGEQSFANASFRRALAASGGTQESLASKAVSEAAQWHLQRLDDRLQRLGIARDARRIVDKLPDNYLLAGWLRIAFPNAAIVHCLRDPRDVALSCWQTQFAKIRWGLRLEHIAHRIEQHRRLLRHWRATIGGHLVELRYERLVANPEVEIRRVLAAMGIDWHPDVMDFSERKGYVGSASRHQVRESLHSRGIGRWRNYVEALRPILPRLEAVVAQDAIEATPDLQL